MNGFNSEQMYKVGDEVEIDYRGAKVVLKVLSVHKSYVRLGFEGPREIAIVRKEVGEKMG